MGSAFSRGRRRVWLCAGLLGIGVPLAGAAFPVPTPEPSPPVPAPARVAVQAQPGDQEKLPGDLPAIGEKPKPGPAPRAGAGADSANNKTDQVRVDPLLPPAPTLLPPNVQPIDLTTALRLAGVQNPDLLIARQRVVEADALRQLAAAQILPTINLGTNYDAHQGVLQQSNGNILSVNRTALYLGGGSNAVAAGTVNIPGIVLSGNAAVAIYGILTSRQVVAQREFASIAVRNQAFLATTLAYSELLRAEGRRAVADQVRQEARIVAKQTAAYAESGQGRKADADRAATELARRESDVQAAEGAVLVASARLAEVINVDPSVRLHPTDAWVVPSPIVPDPVPLCELIALALLQRPELAERRAAIREAFLVLEGAHVLPFSPTILIGYSAGAFGGGSNLVRPVFGGFGGRTDFDAVAYWSIQNLGVGNLALINVARARLRLADYQQIAVLDRVRAEVAEAYARTHARYAQIGTAERAVRSGLLGFREGLDRILGEVAPAIEVVDNLRLLATARYEYLDAIVDYNRAQFELYVALGQPPANTLAHPVPVGGVGPTDLPGTKLPPAGPPPGRGGTNPPAPGGGRNARPAATVPNPRAAGMVR